MKEGNIQNSIRLAISKMGGAIALRNHTGTFQTLQGQWVHAGLGTGTSDLVGLVEHVIRPEDVGKKVGVFLALEVKTETGRLRPEQKAFLSRVAELGGLAAVVRSPEDSNSILSEKWDSPFLYKATKRCPLE
jgi:hypothetical protein